MIHIITFSSENSPDTVYLEDLISFQVDLKDLDEFPEELNDISSPYSNKSPEQEQEQFSCASSPFSSACSQSSDQKSPPHSPFSHIKHSYTIPKSSASPETFTREAPCVPNITVFYAQCVVCLDPTLKCSIKHQVLKH